MAVLKEIYTEIELTVEIIEAGALELFSWWVADSFGDDCIRAVYVSMERARREGARKNPRRRRTVRRSHL